jgi:hypothetical protein
MALNEHGMGHEIASLVLKKYVGNLRPFASGERPQSQQAALICSRVWTFESYLKPQLDGWVSWLAKSREQSNFTYELTDLNQKQLAGTIDAVTNCGIVNCQSYFEEVKQDRGLRQHLNRKTLESPFGSTADLGGGFGRRIGWYAFVRITKPRIVVETGVDKGLGSCVIASALIRNAAEGFPGKYIGTDINPHAGYLFADSYASAGEILYGDSIESLSSISEPIDLFINDSDHSETYEANEYRVIHSKLRPGAIVIGDNAHATSALFDYSLRTNRRFLFFAEKPKDHFYPGAGIGISF